MKESVSNIQLDDAWLDRIESVVASQENFIVPVRWVLRKLGPAAPLSEDDLLRYFESSRQYQIYDGLDLDDEGPIAQFSLAEQEAMGIFQGPKVMLINRVPTHEQIMQFLISKADQTYDALLRAWDIRPPSNDAVEDELLRALAKAQKLKRELRAVLQN